MSEIYRDDTMEIAVLSNKAWTTIYHTVEERARVSEVVTLGLGFMVTEDARAADFISGYRGYLTIETARAKETVSAQRNVVLNLSSLAKLKNTAYLKFSESIEETAALSDAFFGGSSVFVVERAKARTTVDGIRNVEILVSDGARLKERVFETHSVEIVDSLKLSGTAFHQLYAAEHLVEQAQLIDSVLVEASNTEWIIESAHANEVLSTSLIAIGMLTERAFAYEQILDLDLLGSAWVANMDTWAMSRYAPYNFEGAAVLDGKLYLWGADGVYLEGVSGEVIYGSLTTGKLDMGEKLTHPLASYLEYQLDGETAEISMSVTSTQSGLPQSFKYHLPKEQAQHLTNGRIVFGRGLRGRHFSYKLEISGTAAEIDALSVEHAPTARRI